MNESKQEQERAQNLTDAIRAAQGWLSESAIVTHGPTMALDNARAVLATNEARAEAADALADAAREIMQQRPPKSSALKWSIPSWAIQRLDAALRRYREST